MLASLDVFLDPDAAAQRVLDLVSERVRSRGAEFEVVEVVIPDRVEDSDGQDDIDDVVAPDAPVAAADVVEKSEDEAEAAPAVEPEAEPAVESEAEPAVEPEPEPEPATPDERGSVATAQEIVAAASAPVIPSRAWEDEDHGWGDGRDDEDRILRERPPHW